jgi:hypothetical protein
VQDTVDVDGFFCNRHGVGILVIGRNQGAKITQNFEKLHIFCKKVHTADKNVDKTAPKTAQINKKTLNRKKSGGLWWNVGRIMYLCG